MNGNPPRKICCVLSIVTGHANVRGFAQSEGEGASRRDLGTMSAAASIKRDADGAAAA